MARASYDTLLSLDRYAKIMGISPAHFNQAVGEDIFPAAGGCSDLWFQHSWQMNDRVSREDLALAIKNAEEDIAEFMGYWPSPKFIEAEVHPYPRPYRRYLKGSGYNNRYDRKSIKPNYGRLVSPGRRATAKIDDATVAGGEMVFSDDDGDGYSETVTITVATTLTDVNEIKVFYNGETTPEWEIRPVRSKEITGGNVVLVFWAWQFIDPDLWETLPGTIEALDLEGAIYVDEVDVVRVYVDNSQASAVFYWEPRYDSLTCPTCGGTGCYACQLTTQNGCCFIRDVEQGVLVPAPATYDADNEVWNTADYDVCYEPDQVKIYYYSGDQDQRYLDGRTHDPLSDRWAKIIAMIATARLDRDFCSCKNLATLVDDWRRDLTRVDRDGPNFFISDRDRDNPFGTRKGEIMAYRQMSRLIERRGKVALI